MTDEMNGPPREPTVDMVDEGVNVMRVTGGNIFADVRAMWRAMWDAAPPAAPPVIVANDNKIAAPAADALVAYALNRMCTPLDDSRLSGCTAKEDARCMAIIRAHVEQQARELADEREERKDWARRFILDGRTPWEWENLCRRAEAERDALAGMFRKMREGKAAAESAEATLARIDAILYKAAL